MARSTRIIDFTVTAIVDTEKATEKIRPFCLNKFADEALMYFKNHYLRFQFTKDTAMDDLFKN